MKKILFSYSREKILAVIITTILWSFFVVQAGDITKEVIAPIEFKFASNNMIVQNVSPENVDVELTGKNADFDLLGSSGIRAVIDTSGLNEGPNRIQITPDDIQTPNAFSVSGVTPKFIRFDLEPQQNGK